MSASTHRGPSIELPTKKRKSAFSTMRDLLDSRTEEPGTSPTAVTYSSTTSTRKQSTHAGLEASAAALHELSDGVSVSGETAISPTTRERAKKSHSSSRQRLPKEKDAHRRRSGDEVSNRSSARPIEKSGSVQKREKSRMYTN